MKLCSSVQTLEIGSLVLQSVTPLGRLSRAQTLTAGFLNLKPDIKHCEKYFVNYIRSVSKVFCSENKRHSDCEYIYFTPNLRLDHICKALRYLIILKLLPTVPWLRQLAAILSQRRPGFTPWSVRVGFMVDNVALGQDSLRILQFPSVNIIPLSIVVYRLEDEQ
jgi:hypothetical protein